MTLDGVLAVDIGGTKTAVGIVLPDASVVVRDRIATPTRDPWPSIARVVSRVLAAAPDVRLTAVGVGCGGPMDDHGVSPLHIPTGGAAPTFGERERLRVVVDRHG